MQHTDFLHRISYIDNADFIENTLLKTYQSLLDKNTMEDFLNELDGLGANWKELFNLIKINNMACYEPTAQGVYLGLIRLSKVLNQPLNYDIFLFQLK